MNLDLSDPQVEALAQELAGIVEGARYPLSPRISALRTVPGKLRPETVGERREPLPTRGVYEPPSRGRYRRRG